MVSLEHPAASTTLLPLQEMQTLHLVILVNQTYNFNISVFKS